MPEEIKRKKGKHLTWEARYEIQKGLREHLTLKEIAERIGCDQTTVSKEIRLHRYAKEYDPKRYKPNECKYRDTCRKKNVCQKKTRNKCKIPCRKCPSCNKLCPYFVYGPCPIEKRAPFVCNGCSKQRNCLFQKYIYSADSADREYKVKLHTSREGIDMTRDELIELDNLISPLIRKGQPLSHIMAGHKNEIPCSERTLYTYISKGYLSIKNVDMRRVVRYRKRRREKAAVVNSKRKEGHLYEDFLNMLEVNPKTSVTEMDTVEGVKGGKLLMTFLHRNTNLMLAYLIDNKEMATTIKVVNNLEEMLGLELFRKTFPVILTDNGSEFADPDLFETGKDNEKRCEIYYCEPRMSNQKGKLEKNHEYIRYILPKGKSFDDLTQEKVMKIVNHINSTARPGFGGISPMALALEEMDEKVLERLGLELIKADEICLTPELLK